MRAKIREYIQRARARRAAQGRVDDLAWKTFRGKGGEARAILALSTLYLASLFACISAGFGLHILIGGSRSPFEGLYILAMWLWNRAPYLICTAVLFAWFFCRLYVYAEVGRRVARSTLQNNAGAVSAIQQAAHIPDGKARASVDPELAQTRAFHDACLNAHGQRPVADPATEAIKFSLSITGGQWLLDHWLNGNYDAIRREWPDAPSAMFPAAR